MKMKIEFSPARSSGRLALSKSGAALIVNGESFDFGFLQDGQLLPRAAVTGDWLASDVTRVGSTLHLTVTLPHGPNAPEETRFPAQVTVTGDGQITVPPYDVEEDAA